MKLDALVSGKASGHLAITNTGFEAARLRVRLDQLEVDGACVHVESEDALRAAEEALQAHESSV